MVSVKSEGRIQVLRHPMIIGIKGLLGVILIGWILYIASLFPLAKPIAPVALLAYIWMTYRRPHIWLLIVPAMLPVMNFAPWSGWLLIDEFDLIILATIAVGLLKGYRFQLPRSLSLGARLALLFWLCTLLIAFYRGVTPFTAFDPSALSATYLTPYNGIRVLKGTVLALLLVPFWWALKRRHEERVDQWLIQGVSLGLVLFGLSILWERGVIHALLLWDKWAFIQSLLDFTTTHRAVGLLSEMHTGGSAIDGYLAVSMPVAAAGLLLNGKNRTFWLALLGCSLGGFAVISTFTRGTYAALGISLIAFIWFALRLRSTGNRWVSNAWLILPALLLFSVTLFVGGGLGGVAALASLSVGYLVGVALFVNSRQWPILGLIATFLLLVALNAWMVGYGLSSSRWVANEDLTVWSFSICSAFIALSTGYITWSKTATSRFNGRLLMVLTLAIALPIATLASGGYRMQERISQSGKDLDTRIAHLTDGYRLVGNTFVDQLFGIGMGRFPITYIMNKSDEEAVGTYTYIENDTDYSLRLGGGRDLRIGQRIDTPDQGQGPLTFSGRYRWQGEPGRISGSVCRRHLLEQNAHNSTCTYFAIRTAGESQQWTPFSLPVAIDKLGRSRWDDAKFTLLRIGAGNTPTVIDLDELNLTDKYGRTYLSNGDFASGGERWFSYNDFEHLAWHAKNMYLGLYIEQGALGLVGFIVICLVSLRVLYHSAITGSVLSIGLLGMLLGFLSLGLVATLLDVPRVLFLFTLLLLIALSSKLCIEKSTKSI